MNDSDPSRRDDVLTRPSETPVDAGSQALSEALRSSFGIVKIVMVLLVGLFLVSGFFIVEPQEQAIVIRLGKPVGEGEKALKGPGWHWSFPYPIDEPVKVPITSIQKVRSTIGWYQTTRELELARNDYPALPVGMPMNPLDDGYLLTAEENIVHSIATLTNHIADPVTYIFNFRNASNSVQRALDNALLGTAAAFKVDDILYRDIPGFNEAVRQRVVDLVKAQELGVVVEECQVESRAPRQLKDAFESVTQAELKRSKLMNEARNYEIQVTNRASAEAQAKISAAETYRSSLTNDLAGEAERFTGLLPEFKRNPSLFAQQRLADTLSRVLTNATDKVFLSSGGAGSQPRELRLMLNREPPKQNQEQKHGTSP